MIKLATKSVLRCTFRPIKRSLGSFGYIGEVKRELLSSLYIESPVTILELDIETLIAHKHSFKRFVPIPKYPPSFEDMAFIILPKTRIGDLTSTPSLSIRSSLMSRFLIVLENTRTLHVTYLSPLKNLTSEDTRPVREKILAKLSLILERSSNPKIAMD